MSLNAKVYESWSFDNNLNGAKGVVNLTSNGSNQGYSTGKISNAKVYAAVTGNHDSFSYNSAIPAGGVNFWYYRIGNPSGGVGAYGRIFQKTQVGVTDVLGIGAHTGGTQFIVYIQDQFIYQDSGTSFPDNTWVMGTVTWDGTTEKCYLNGSLVSTTTHGVSVQANSAAYCIGGWTGNGSQQINGRIDGVTLFTATPTDAEVSDLYNAGAGQQYPFISAGENVDSITISESVTVVKEVELEEDLIAAYNFDTSTGNLVDSTGNGNTLTNTGSTPFATGLAGEAASFNGSNNRRLGIASSNLSLANSGNYTISFRFNLASFSTGYLYDQVTNSGAQRRIILYPETTSGNRISFFFSGNEVKSTGSRSTGVWYHLMVVKTGTSFECFIDNVSQGTISWGTVDYNANAFSLGSPYDGFGALTNGLIDNVLLWGRSLSSTEQTIVHNGGAAFQFPFTEPAYEVSVFDSVSISESTDTAIAVSVFDPVYVNEWVTRIPVNPTPTTYTALTTKQVIYGGLPTSAPSVSAVSWATIHSQNSSETWAATQAWRRTIFSGTVRPIRIFYTLSAPPGVGKSYEFALVSDVSTVISTVTISDLNTTGFTNFSFNTIPAETTLSIRCTPTGTPDSTFVMWGFAYETTEDNIFIINGSTGSGPTATDGAVSYNHIMGGGTWSTTTSALRENISSLPFIIRKFSVRTAAPGTGNSRTMAVVLNGVQQTATNLVFGATDALLTVSGLDILVLPGDTLSIVNIASGTPTTSGLNTWSISAENFYLGESWVAGSTTDATGSSPSFIRIKNSSASTESATASDVHRLSVGPAHTLKDFIVWDKTSTRQTAPGFLTNEIYIGLAKNGTLDTNTTATLGKSNVTQRLNSSTTIVEGDNLSVRFDSFIGSPLSPTVAHAFTQYIQPTFFTPVSITEAVTAVQIIPAEEVSVFDSIGITESVTLTTTATWSVSVSDTVSITETTAQQRNAFVSVVDTLAITENINLNRISNLSVSDSVTVTESVTATFVGAGFSASVFDAITLTENTTNLRSINIAPFDAFTITENITRLQTLFTTAAENVSVLESTTQHVVNFVNIFDLVSITESATSAIVLARSVSDTLTISESVTLERPVTSIQLPQDRYKGTAKRINMKVGGSI